MTSPSPMGDPSEEQKKVIGEVTRLRGLIIQSYAHVEYLLADIVVRAQCMHRYRREEFVFPSSFEDRVTAVLALVEREGPLQKYSDEIREAISDFLRFKEHRHFMAHGILVLKGNGIHMKLYRPHGKKPAEYGFFDATLDQLAFTAEEITKECSALVRLFHRIYLAEKLAEPE